MASKREPYPERVEENPDEIFIWYDKVRPCPDGLKFRWAHTIAEAIELMKTGDVYFATLGNVVDFLTRKDVDGIELLYWMAENNTRHQLINIHTTSTANAAQMKHVIERYSTLHVHCISDNDGWDKPLGVKS